MMATTSKRIPKRSIIGSRVCVGTDDGMWRHGRVTSIRPDSMFSVRLEQTDQVVDHHESRILGPGFLSCLPVTCVLVSGQQCYLTHNGREVEGVVTHHNQSQDCVEVDVKDVGVIRKRLEEIRLMESRKSARLVNTDTDFSLLADFNIVEQRKLAQETSSSSQPLVSSRRRLHSMSDFLDRKHQRSDQERREAKRRQRSERQTSKLSSCSIDVPGSRKRRTSDSRAELDSGYGSSFGSGFFRTEENLTECTAAMVLMNLSVSPRDKFRCGDGFSDLSSPPPITPRPSPAPSLSHIHLSEDEEPYKRPRHSAVCQYQCTWRGCDRVESCQMMMEKHVREHLGLPDPPPGTDYGGEEDFYYTEIETGDQETGIMEMDPTTSDSGCSSESNDGGSYHYQLQQSEQSSSPKSFIKILPSSQSSSPATLASSVPSNFGSSVSQSGASIPADQSQTSNHLLDHIGMARPSYEAPTTIYLVNTTPHKNKDHLYNANSWQGKKLVSIVPKTDSFSQDQETIVFKQSQTLMKSDKKCRKVC